MKNNGLIITLIILLSIIIFGLVYFLIMCLNGNFSFMNMGMFGRKSTNIMFDEVYEESLIDKLEIIQTAGDIELKESTDGNIRIVAYGEDSNKLKVTLENNELKIDYSAYGNKTFFFNSYTNDIIVYIPKEYSKEINIDSEYGDCKIFDLENATMTINQACGDVELGKVKNITVTNNLGDVKISSVLNKCNIESNCGDVKISDVQINEDSFIALDLGDVKIANINDIFVDAKTGLGDTKVSSSNRYSEITLKIKNSCGDIKVGD